MIPMTSNKPKVPDAYYVDIIVHVVTLLLYR